MLSIESPADSDIINLRPLKTRDASPTPFSARIHFEGNKFWLTPQNETTRRVFAEVESAILKHLASISTSTTPALMAALDMFSPASVRQAVYDLKVAGYVARINGEKRGAVAEFQLTPKGRAVSNESVSKVKP